MRSYDNIKYHQSCHAQARVCENTLKDALSENENIPESKRRRIVHSKHTFDCPECSVGMNSWKQMKSHLWKSHSVDMELYSCDQCSYKTPRYSIDVVLFNHDILLVSIVKLMFCVSPIPYTVLVT